MKFIELRFGQGDLGKKMIYGEDEAPTFVQKEIVPVKAILDAYVILPEKRNIKITWKVGPRTFSRVEYYKDEIDCIKRWVFIKKACGFSSRDQLKMPVPLAMDVEEMEKRKIEEDEKRRAEERKKKVAEEAYEKAKAEQEKQEFENRFTLCADDIREAVNWSALSARMGS